MQHILRQQRRKAKLEVLQPPANWVVHTVPADVWRIIFAFYVQTSPKQSFEEHSSRQSPPMPTELNPCIAALIASQICSKLRYIVIHAPELWTKVRLHIIKNGAPYPGLNALHAILGRSHSMLLELEITTQRVASDPRNPTKARQRGTQALRLIFNHAHRAKYLSISVDIVQDLLFDAYPETRVDKWWTDRSAEALEVLSITGRRDCLETETRYRYTYTPEMSINHSISGLWHSAKRLRSLFVSDYLNFDADLNLHEGLRMPLENLTALCLGTKVDVQDFFNMLSGTKKLVKCSVTHMIGSLPFSHHSTATPLLLPVLEILTLQGQGAEDGNDSPPMSMFLSLLSTPKLNTLYIIRDWGWSPHAFSTFICNSDCRIRELHFEVEDSTTQAKIQCLGLLSHLERLYFPISPQRRSSCGLYVEYEDYIGEDFSNSMKRWDETNRQFVICPMLKKISVDNRYICDEDESVIADMVEERWRGHGIGPHSLQKVELVGALEDGICQRAATALPSHEMIRLLVLKRDGLDVDIVPGCKLEALICR